MDFVTVLEGIGYVAFALVGVFVAIEYELDIFGIYVVSLCCAFGGGVIRDLILGITPPSGFTQVWYIVTVLVTVTICLILFKILDKHLPGKAVRRMKRVVDMFDAVGLGIFAVNGCITAIEAGYGDNFILMIFVGTITGVGGGMIRDLLCGRKPVVLRREIYALAAILGCIVFYFIYDKMSLSAATYICTALIAIIRIISCIKRLNVSYAIKNADLKIDE